VGQHSRCAMRCPRPGQTTMLYDASSAEANACGHLRCHLPAWQIIHARRAWAPLESHGFVALMAGLAWQLRTGVQRVHMCMGGIKNLHPVTRNGSVVCQAGARAKFSSTLELCDPSPRPALRPILEPIAACSCKRLRPSSRARIRSLQIERVGISAALVPLKEVLPSLRTSPSV
jgi:hypothetical protein